MKKSTYCCGYNRIRQTKLSSYFILALFFFLSFPVLAQAPANDDCEGAIALTVNNDLLCGVVTSATNVEATESTVNDDSCYGTPNDDVWFSFVAQGPNHQVTISNVVAVSGSSTDMYFQVLSGTCGDMTSLFCSDPNSRIVSGLTAGETYYVRVYSYSTSSRQTFDVCLNTIPEGPANDDCANAVVLTPSTDENCVSTTAGTTVGATQSMEADPCNGTANDDVWFSFTATSVAHTITLSDIESVVGTSVDMYFQVLSGACGSMSSIVCSDPNTNIAAGLTVGETYYVRVYSYYSTSMQDFDICVTTPPAPPVNDECDGAVALTVNPDLSCGNVTAATTVSATQSEESGACYGTPNDDVWFTFVAEKTTHRISITDVEAVEGTSTDMYFQVFSGNCESKESLLCSDPESDEVEDLTVGETYYVRVYSYYTSSRQNFNICVGTFPPPPANDNCEGAIALTVNNDLSCDNAVAATTVSATQSMEAGECGGTPDDDVWFSFTATKTSHVINLTDITNVEGYGTDMYFQVLSGTCGDMASLVCSDPNSALLSDLTVGETYYVRVYSYNSTSRQDFTICVGSLPEAPANDECDNAVALTVSADEECTGVVAGTTVSATQSMEAEPCQGEPNDDVWYSFIATSEFHTVTLSDVEAVLGTSSNMYMQILGGTCGTLESVLCSNADVTSFGNLTVGETYYVRVYSYSDTSSQNFNICVTTPPAPPANDECTGAVALTVNPDEECTDVTAGSTQNALQSSVPASCYGTPNDDVWYSFVATGSAHIITLSDVEAIEGSSTDMYFEVLGGECGNMESLLCSDPNSNDVSGLTAGETYYVRVYSYGTSSSQNFNICISTPPAPPANDECENATVLTVNADLSCDNVTAGTTVSATQTMESGECNGTPNDDVWYSFVAQDTRHQVTISDVVTVDGWSTDMYFQVLSGTCGTMESLLCSDPNSGTVDGLTIGETYYVRVYSYGSSSTQNFNICIGTLPPPPANDMCADAIELTVGLDFETAAVATTNEGGNHDDSDPTPTCDSTGFAAQGSDIWFTVVVPPTGEISIETRSNENSEITDTGLAAYTGTCGDLSLIECNSDDGDGNFSLLELSGLEPGTVLYVRTWGYNGTTGQFDIAAYAEPCDVAAPAGDETQELTLGDTLEDLDVDGDNLTWYSDAELTMEIDVTTVAVDGTTYYVTQTEVACVSEALAVTVTVVDPCEGVTAPTAEATQELTLGDTLLAIVIEGMDGADYTWYSDAELTTEIDVTTEAVDGTTYYVVQTYEDCISEALAITVTVVDPCEGVTAPTVEATQELTLGDTLSAIVIVGMDGADYTWYSDAELTTEIDATTEAVDGTTYYVVQTYEECVSDAIAITVTVTDPCAGVTAPTGDAIQDFTEGQTIADLEVTGDNLTWYSDAELTTEIEVTTVLVDEATYYVTQTVGECTSEALAVTVNQVANTDVFGKDNFTYYPNPVTDVFTLSAQEEIKKVTIFNMLGQEVYTNGFQSNTVELDLSQLSAGSYFVNVSTANASKVVKILKN